MNFKKLRHIDKVLQDYPNICTASITYGLNNYRVKPLRLYLSDSDIVFDVQSNEHLEGLNIALEEHLGEYTTLDQDVMYKYQMIFTQADTLEMCSDVGCFKEKGKFLIVTLSNDTFSLKLVLSSSPTFLNNLSFKASFKSKMAKEMMLYLLSNNLVGNLGRIDIEYEGVLNTYQVISPADGYVNVANPEPSSLNLTYLFTGLHIPAEELENASFMVTYTQAATSLAYNILIRTDKLNVTLVYLPL